MEGFSAWKVGAPFYVPLLVAGVGLTALWSDSLLAILGLLILGLGVFTLAFFRDPARTIPQDELSIVSPADGKIVAIDEIEDRAHYDGPCVRITIFLSVFNVHVNRSPYAASVRGVEYRPGKFLNAMSPKSSEENEASTLRLDTERGAISVRQIAGLIARRIVCVTKEGDRLGKGDRFGMIRFGSRTELYVPRSCSVEVVVNQHVKGGESVLAHFPEGEITS